MDTGYRPVQIWTGTWKELRRISKVTKMSMTKLLDQIIRDFANTLTDTKQIDVLKYLRSIEYPEEP